MGSIPGREPTPTPRAPDGAAAAVGAEEFRLPAPAATGVSVRSMEALTALAFAGAGAVAIWDSARLGAGWGADGPQSGYFPFWIGVLLVAASLANLGLALRPGPKGHAPALFISWGQARTVGSVFLPTAAYVAAIPFAGIYLASALLVAWFMARLGGFAIWRALASGAATALVAFVVFETWFLVALPKGPIETALGF